MGSIAISSIVLASVFGGALFGMFLRAALPQHHLSGETKDVVKLGSGLVATMYALVLGLLVASAKSSYDAQGSELTEMSGKVVLLDRVLAHYGPETKEVRDVLRSTVVNILDRMWPKVRAQGGQLEAPSARAEVLVDKIQQLTPKDERQRLFQSQALSIVLSLGQTRWLQFAQGVSSVSKPLLVLLVFWLSTIFVSFGLFAPRNGTAVASLFISALSVSGAILLILELYSPYVGLVNSRAPPCAQRSRNLEDRLLLREDLRFASIL